MIAKVPYRVLAVIPARGGSKGVPQKNIRSLEGEPLIAYTIRAAQQSRTLDRVIVSTDAEPIAMLARRYEVEVPFLRPTEFAQDDTPDQPVLRHALQWLQENENYSPDYVALLRPTTPFKTAAIIDAAVQCLVDTGADSVRSVTKVGGGNHPYWMYVKADASHRARPFVDDPTVNVRIRRQLLPPVYRLNGVVDVIRRDVVLHSDWLYGNDMRLFEVAEEQAVDIDTEFDFELCAWLMRRSRDGAA